MYILYYILAYIQHNGDVSLEISNLSQGSGSTVSHPRTLTLTLLTWRIW